MGEHAWSVPCIFQDNVATYSLPQMMPMASLKTAPGPKMHHKRAQHQTLTQHLLRQATLQ